MKPEFKRARHLQMVAKKWPDIPESEWGSAVEMHTKDSFLTTHGVDVRDRSQRLSRFHIGRLWKDANCAVRTYCRKRREYEELSNLSDHILADIGLKRSDLEKPRLFAPDKGPIKARRAR